MTTDWWFAWTTLWGLLAVVTVVTPCAVARVDAGAGAGAGDLAALQ